MRSAIISGIVAGNLIYYFRQKALHAREIDVHNRPFARWRHFTTATRILYVFPSIFKVGNPSED